MAFSETIKLVIDVAANGATSTLKGLKNDVDEADGAFNKIKTGASGVFGGIGGVVSAGLAGAASAIAGFGLKAIGDFQAVALGAGEMSDKLGLPVEDASRLMEVAGDLGIEVGTLESAMGRMNLTAGKAPEKFAAIGAEIAKNKDGTTDVTQTFKNAAEAIAQIPDAAARAKAGTEVFGKGWASISELVMSGADGITAAMASVENSKVIDEGEVEKAREFRDMLDALKGKFESFALSVGGVLVDAAAGWQVLIDKAQEYGDTAARWLTFRDARQTIYDNLVAPIKEAGDEIEATFNQDASKFLAAVRAVGEAQEINTTVDAFAHLSEQLGYVDGRLQGTATSFAGVDYAIGSIPGAVKNLSDHLQNLQEAQELVTEASKAQAEAQDELNDSLLEGVDAARSAADMSIELDDAQREVTDAITATVAAQKEHGAASREAEDATRAERDAIIGAASAQQDWASKQYEAAGASLNATGKLDVFNKSLLDNASRATPAARAAIVEYIIQANQIPEEKATEIRALIAQGKLAEAEAAINNTSRTRNSTVYVDANTRAAEDEIRNLIRTRNMTINANIVAHGGAGYGGLSGARAAGGTEYRGSDATLVGENGPELVRMPQGAHVYRNSEQPTRDALSGGGGGPMVVNNISIVMPPGARGADVIDAIKKYERTNGTSWRRS